MVATITEIDQLLMEEIAGEERTAARKGERIVIGKLAYVMHKRLVSLFRNVLSSMNYVLGSRIHSGRWSWGYSVDGQLTGSRAAVNHDL
jgi:hypothetical protein